MSMSTISYEMCNVFLGEDNKRAVHWHVIPVHIWHVEAFKHRVQVQDNVDDLTTEIINEEQHLLIKHTVNVRHEELISYNPHDSILYRILRSQGVPAENSRSMIRRVARLARSMIMPNVRPIFVVLVDVVAYASRQVMELIIEEMDDETLASVMRPSMEDEAVKIVPATKSSIDKLEKVKIKLDSRCSICLEEFVGGVEEVARMPCSHIYHTHCIVKWLEYNHLCPLCRFEMPKSID